MKKIICTALCLSLTSTTILVPQTGVAASADELGAETEDTRAPASSLSSQNIQDSSGAEQATLKNASPLWGWVQENPWTTGTFSLFGISLLGFAKEVVKAWRTPGLSLAEDELPVEGTGVPRSDAAQAPVTPDHRRGAGAPKKGGAGGRHGRPGGSSSGNADVAASSRNANALLDAAAEPRGAATLATRLRAAADGCDTTDAPLAGDARAHVVPMTNYHESDMRQAQAHLRALEARAAAQTRQGMLSWFGSWFRAPVRVPLEHVWRDFLNTYYAEREWAASASYLANQLSDAQRGLETALTHASSTNADLFISRIRNLIDHAGSVRPQNYTNLLASLEDAGLKQCDLYRAIDALFTVALALKDQELGVNARPYWRKDQETRENRRILEARATALRGLLPTPLHQAAETFTTALKAAQGEKDYAKTARQGRPTGTGFSDAFAPFQAEDTLQDVVWLLAALNNVLPQDGSSDQITRTFPIERSAHNLIALGGSYQDLLAAQLSTLGKNIMAAQNLDLTAQAEAFIAAVRRCLEGGAAAEHDEDPAGGGAAVAEAPTARTYTPEDIRTAQQTLLKVLDADFDDLSQNKVDLYERARNIAQRDLTGPLSELTDLIQEIGKGRVFSPLAAALSRFQQALESNASAASILQGAGGGAAMTDEQAPDMPPSGGDTAVSTADTPSAVTPSQGGTPRIVAEGNTAEGAAAGAAAEVSPKQNNSRRKRRQNTR